MNNNKLEQCSWFNELPLIAILRGIEPEEVIAVTEELLDVGFRYIEIPLNSPQALKSISLVVDKFGDQAVVGAGTVTSIEKLLPVIETGAKLIVTPNMNPDVIRKAREHDCVIFSGIQTPTEAFTALECGASALKLFPAELIQPNGLKAIRSVLPPEVICCPTGGIDANPEQMRAYVQAGANGFGLGSGLYKKGLNLSQIRKRAHAYRDSWMSI
ncbi:2-dehydro-3-deoxy-6-phosphogalactonate aldolase [Vibrio sp. TRT 21S02]|uniref:2-dehydro-3-deoxy-6-phosphogalactonate aldolase n=1 Tax=Vibrio sp. TRT 21S02 TaxID=3418507 RepID=UPI003CF0DDCC